MKGVFQTKMSPAYDDVPEEYYHFPRAYLNQVERTIGDWIVYYEPRRATADVLSRGGRQSYFAHAQVVGIRPDPMRAEHFYADIDSFLLFDNPVPFREGEHFHENAMRGADGKTNSGSAQRAVRNMTDTEFEQIVRAGYVTDLQNPVATNTHEHGFEEELAVFERPIVETTISRPFRDRVFTRQIQAAYDKKCALTGFRIINGGGRPEAQAAHIRPVQQDGPDSVRNGLSLSSTLHWMFDRGLISVDDDFRILKAKGAMPSEVEKLFNPTGYLIVPDDVRNHPHAQFLRFHRETIFKG
ncbi:MAG: restriction endonuclease [Rhizobiales bacterium]|nr:restriction endonuclease [Hyphomicrobiales bacterium]